MFGKRFHRSLENIHENGLITLKYVFDDMEEEEGRRYDLPKKRDLIFETFSDNDLKAHERALHSH